MTNRTTVSEIKKAQKEKHFFRILVTAINDLALDDVTLRALIPTKATLSVDKSCCTLYFYTPEGQEHFQTLVKPLLKYEKYLRKHLAAAIDGRYVPELRFKFDDLAEKQGRLDELLHKISATLTEDESSELDDE